MQVNQTQSTNSHTLVPVRGNNDQVAIQKALPAEVRTVGPRLRIQRPERLKEMATDLMSP